MTGGLLRLAGARIGLDLDGVCCDYIAYLRQHLITAGRDPAALPSPRDYRLTEWGQMPCPALDALLAWAERRDDFEPAVSSVRITTRGP